MMIIVPELLCIYVVLPKNRKERVWVEKCLFKWNSCVKWCIFVIESEKGYNCGSFNKKKTEKHVELLKSYQIKIW